VWGAAKEKEKTEERPTHYHQWRTHSLDDMKKIYSRLTAIRQQAKYDKAFRADVAALRKAADPGSNSYAKSGAWKSEPTQAQLDHLAEAAAVFTANLAQDHELLPLTATAAGRYAADVSREAAAVAKALTMPRAERNKLAKDANFPKSGDAKRWERDPRAAREAAEAALQARGLEDLVGDFQAHDERAPPALVARAYPEAIDHEERPMFIRAHSTKSAQAIARLLELKRRVEIMTDKDGVFTKAQFDPHAARAG